jgi:hypothetical protein
MYELTETEIDLISRDIDQQGLTYTLLKNELLDHICCSIEEDMEKGMTWCIQQPELTEGTTGGGLGCVSREPVRHLTGNRTTRSSESLYQWLFIKDCPVIRRRD